GKAEKPNHVMVDEDNIILLTWKCIAKWVLTVSPNGDIVTLYNEMESVLPIFSI
ncbi:26714_t:CDS:1, partial [Racocetra persica]